MRGLRFLHIMSPVKWEHDTYLNNADANFKVLEKTLSFLPDNHHYILVPEKHNINLSGYNVTFIPYKYPRSIHLNRGFFNYRDIKFDFKRADIDFVVLHQPELAYQVELWLSSNRYHRSVKMIGFFHWIDCPANTYYDAPSFYMRQLEAMSKLDASFIHTDKSLDWMLTNFKNYNVATDFMNVVIKKIHYFPLSAHVSNIIEPFELPNKNILVFNHRWGKSSGIKRLKEYVEHLPDNFVVWVTDEKCDMRDHPKYIVKTLNQAKYNYLMSNCYAGLCFIDTYTTWNMAVQDAPLHGRPTLYFMNKNNSGRIIQRVLGNSGIPFTDVNDFIEVLTIVGRHALNRQSVPELPDHDREFKEYFLDAINMLWQDTNSPTVNMEKWMECIEGGMWSKFEISKTVQPNVDLNTAFHFIRRNLLHRGVKDDIRSPYTKYYLGDVPPENENLFGV